MRLRLELNTFGVLILILGGAVLAASLTGPVPSLRVPSLRVPSLRVSIAPLGSATVATATVEGVGTISLRISR